MQENIFFLTEQLIYFLFIPLGLSLIIQTKIWIDIIKLLYSQEDKIIKIICVLSGTVLLPFGAILVLTHNDWIFSSSLIVTLVGWCIVTKCIFLILFPQLALKYCRCISQKNNSWLNNCLKIQGVIHIILGGLVCYHFWIF